MCCSTADCCRSADSCLSALAAGKQVFGRAAFETQGKYFRSLLFSSERKSGHKHVLRFCLSLPPEGAMEDLSRWMAAVMTFIDAIGTYKLSPEQRKRAEKVRAPPGSNQQPRD